jgi:CrcB protein
LAVAAGAGLGAPARYLLDQAVRSRGGGIFPWGTAVVNVLGCLLLGLLLGILDATAHAEPSGSSSVLVELLSVGFCGTFTTFSTFGYETVRLIEEGASRLAVLNVIGNLLLGVAAVVLGISLATAA